MRGRGDEGRGEKRRSRKGWERDEKRCDEQYSKLKNNPGCPYFKSRATKAMNLVALMNPWLPERKTNTFKCTTQKNIHPAKVACLSKFFAVLVSFFFLVACIRLAQFSFLLRRWLYTSKKTQHLHSVKDNTCILFC